MRYRTRMTLLYTALVLVLSLAVGVFYYNYNVARFREREQQSLDFFAEDLTRQFDSTVRMMAFGIDALIDDVQVVEALRDLANAGRNPSYPAAYRDSALSLLHRRIYQDLFTDFYRVIIFNRYGDVVANRNNGRSAIDGTVNWDDLPWLDKVVGTGGKNVLVGLHVDDWGREAKPVVYSYVKEVQGNNMGFIEVQYQASLLNEFLQVPNGGVRLFLFHPDGEALYLSHAEEDDADAQAYARLAARLEEGAQGDDAGLTAVYRSDYTGVLALAVLHADVVAAQNRYIIGATLLVSLLFALASVAFVYLISRYLTKPVERLHQIIRHTDIENIGQPIAPLQAPGSARSILEIDSLMDSYQSMTERLARAIQTEREATHLHAKTQFDALQAQVNPHFLFNILNVISQRGMQNGDDTICEICANLAAILRYSTNTRQPLATVEEELTYLAQYAFLQRSRYHYMFDCQTEADKEVLSLLIPRLTIQQIVENSIRHGYANSDAPMRIRVTARHTQVMSILQVLDNGQGFAPEKIAQLRERMDQIRVCIRRREKLPEMQIGGMGLVNIFARLYLVFGDRFSMDFENQGGACVTLYILDEQQAD